ncbi:MAG: hypothetical protein A2475_02605 [Ignavibacteria bacterium RIFOXYC2_FULL_35_21]|nr:MAG: hypothetical protein A2220_00120 [Ignavibacteria bacterium RIFOXYA2_FULL_35_10]OGV19327.1 MAG: hypothetical protein A2475_02605 [Ignavibacteria bacterium RIFOXYC2_FULL_35_21]
MLFTLTAQNHIILKSPNKIRDNGKKEGKWTILFDKDWKSIADSTQAEFYRIINYKDGKPEGIVTDYYITGEMQGECKLFSDDPDVIDDKYSVYFKNGKKDVEGNFIKGIKDGVFTWWNENGEFINGCIYIRDSSYTFDKLVDSIGFYGYLSQYKKQLFYLRYLYNGSKYLYDNKINDSLFIVTLLYYSGILSNYGNIDGALSIYDSLQYLIKIRNNNINNYVIQSSINLGQAWCYFLTGDFKKSEEILNETVELLKKNKIHENLSMCYENLSQIYFNLGNYRNSYNYQLLSYKNDEKLYFNDSLKLTKLYTIIAKFLYYVGDNELANNYLGKAFDFYKLINTDIKNKVELTNMIASCLIERKSYDETEKFLDEAYFKYYFYYKEDLKSRINLIEILSFLNLKKGRTILADSLYHELYKISKIFYEQDPSALINKIYSIANFYSSIEDYKNAEKYMAEIIEIYNNNFLGTRFISFGLEYYALINIKLEQYKKAENYLKNALENFKKNYLTNSSIMSESEMKQYKNTSFIHFEIYYSLIVRDKLNNILILTDMFNNILFTKALVLNSTKKVKERILNSGDSTLSNKFKEWLETKEYIARLYSKTKQELEQIGVNLDSLEQSANDLEKELSRKSEAFAKEFDKKQFTWQDVQSKLNDGEAAIELVRFNYFDKSWTDTVYYAALIITKDTKEHPELVLLENGKDLEEKYYNDYQEIMQPDKLDDGELYTQYWQSIKKKLNGIKKVYLSLDGVYNKINLETLLNLETKEYLADEIELHIVTSTRDLVTAKPAKPTKAKIAYLFGNPNFKLGEEQQMQLASALRTGERQLFSDKLRADLERTTATDLPGTETEVLNIKKIMNEKDWQAKVFTGDSALEEEVKSVDNPTILHIATHGFFFSVVEIVERNINSEGFIKPKVFGMETFKAYENPLLRSGLLFAGSQRTLDGKEDAKSNMDNGILTAYEAMNLKLDNTELVVLSACETGRGEIRNGEGVYGLQRAFIQAGAKTLIMSLWKVSDEATQELMTSFYTKWLSGKTKREAFKEAQNEIRAKYKYPYYWGAFVMVGE